MSDYAAMRNRAQDALEVTQPIAGNVDWYLDTAGQINAVHGAELDMTDRLAVIGQALALDVIDLLDTLERLLVVPNDIWTIIKNLDDMRRMAGEAGE